MSTKRELLLLIAAKLCFIQEDDLSMAEKCIAKLLIDHDYLEFNEHRELHLVEQED